MRALGVARYDIEHHKTSQNLISRSQFSQELEHVDENMPEVHHQRSDSEPEVDTIGIYVENHWGLNSEFVIWIQSDNRKLGDKGWLP